MSIAYQPDLVLYYGMPGESSRSQRLAELLRERKTATLEQMCKQLGNVSPATVFRALRSVPYRSSYNENGRFYALHRESQYDQHGLWSWKGVCFSRDGPLTVTVERLVREAPEGGTQRELQELLGVRVQNVLAGLVERGALSRQKVGRLFVYLSPEEDERQRQLNERRQRIESRPTAEIRPEIVIDILLVLIRHPGSDARAVSRRLRDRSPPVSIEQIREVFDRYGLGQKRGLPTSSS